MKLKYLLLLGFIVVPGLLAGQTIYRVKYESQADIKVYVVEYESQCDLKVYFVDYESQADEDGLWYFVKYESQADIKVYKAKYESQAGWNKPEKQHLLL